jgi:hypothetical protein
MCRVAAVIFPWPSRAERRARVDAARRNAEQARRKAEEAERVQQDLREIMARNHFAQILVEGLMQQRRGHGK